MEKEKLKIKTIDGIIKHAKFYKQYLFLSRHPFLRKTIFRGAYLFRKLLYKTDLKIIKDYITILKL